MDMATKRSQIANKFLFIFSRISLFIGYLLDELIAATVTAKTIIAPVNIPDR